METGYWLAFTRAAKAAEAKGIRDRSGWVPAREMSMGEAFARGMKRGAWVGLLFWLVVLVLAIWF